MSEVSEKVQVIIKSAIGLPYIHPDARMNEDLNVESIEAAEIVSEIEKEFGIKANYQEVFVLKTVGEVIAYVEKQIEEERFNESQAQAKEQADIDAKGSATPAVQNSDAAAQVSATPAVEELNAAAQVSVTPVLSETPAGDAVDIAPKVQGRGH